MACDQAGQFGAAAGGSNTDEIKKATPRLMHDRGRQCLLSGVDPVEPGERLAPANRPVRQRSGIGNRRPHRRQPPVFFLASALACLTQPSRSIRPLKLR